LTFSTSTELPLVLLTINRQFNRAIYTIALTQISRDPRARGYLERKREAGKSSRDAMRRLIGHLARVVYKRLVADHALVLLTWKLKKVHFMRQDSAMGSDRLLNSFVRHP